MLVPPAQCNSALVSHSTIWEGDSPGAIPAGEAEVQLTCTGFSASDSGRGMALLDHVRRLPFYSSGFDLAPWQWTYT